MAVEDSGILFRWLRGDGIAETRCNGVEEATDEPDGRVGDTPCVGGWNEVAPVPAATALDEEAGENNVESLGEIVDESKVS